MLETLIFLGVLFIIFMLCVVLGACAASSDSGNVIILSKIDISPLDDDE